MRRIEHKKGERFGRLVFLRDLGTTRTAGGQVKRYCWVRCDCGEEFAINTYNMRSGVSSSCGCDLVNRITTEPSDRLYAVWKRLRQRCKKHPSYVERRIGYDPRWESFALFCTDMLDKYVPGFHLHRIDSTGNYMAANCEWLAPRAHFMEHHGNPADKIAAA